MIEQLRKAIRTDEFRPFTVTLADGRRFHVGHPELIAIGKEATRTFILAGPGEDYSVIDLLLVTSLDFEGSKISKGRRNGKAR